MHGCGGILTAVTAGVTAGGGVTTGNGAEGVVFRRRGNTQVTQDIIERRDKRLSRVSVTSSLFDLAISERRNSVASC